MDFDSRITSDGSGYGSGHGWHCNFHFGYGQDIIDEDAENEKTCGQVLRLLLAKADAEILDLEDELAILHCQLKWEESVCKKDPYEFFCAVFKRKIDSLTSSIESLRFGYRLNGHHMDATFELQRPTERICDIIYASIRHQFPEFYKKVSTSEGNSKSNALLHGESEKCTGSKMSIDDTLTELAEKEVVVKVEEEYRDVDFQLDAFNYYMFENNSEVTIDKKSSLLSILKPQGKKEYPRLQPNYYGIRQSIPPVIFHKTAKSEILSDAESSRRSSSSFKVQRRRHFLPNTSIQREPGIEENMKYAIPFQANNRQLQATRRQGARAHIKHPKGKTLDTIGRETSTRSLQLTEVGNSKVAFNSAILHNVGSKNVPFEVQTESPAYDLESVRLKLSGDPCYLHKLKKPQLKEIMRQNKISGLFSSKKDKIIEELIKRLGS